MSESQPKRRPPARSVSRQAQAQPPARTASTQAPTARPHGPYDTRDSRVQPPPSGRDAFPYIIGALVGLIIVGLVVTAFLIGSLNSPGQVAAPPNQANSSPNNPGVVITPAASANPSAGTDSLPGIAVPSEGQVHVDEGQPITYTNYPPSSGTHYPSTATYGFSDKEIPEGKLVHSLEHGAIVLYYKPDLPSAQIQLLRDAATKLPTEKHGEVKIVVTPYPKLQTPLALAAWGRLETLQQFDFPKVLAFYQALVDHGPEDVP